MYMCRNPVGLHNDSLFSCMNEMQQGIREMLSRNIDVAIFSQILSMSKLFVI